ncbi:MAG: nucleotidyltransferase family protein [Actinobacteria bacterium]|nr:nucleotidyltransferase family protein [Actinomycetota bacterium]
MYEQLQAVLIGPDATIRDAMETIDIGAVEIALVVTGDGHLLGTVSDGDIRRALLGGATLEDLVEPIMAASPTVVSPDASRADVLDLMRARSLSQVPVVGAEGRLVGLHVMRELLGSVERDNWAVIMAGGRGTRLGSLTAETPKPMLRVAGRPILERIVLHLVGSGIRRIYLAVNYLAEIVEEHFGDGSSHGCSIRYLREDADRPLGSAGALGLLHETGAIPADPVLVMNGDLITDFNVGAMLERHAAGKGVATLAVKEYRHQVPFGVVEEREGCVVDLLEKPISTWQVNAGIYAIEPVLLPRVPTDREFPMTELLEDARARGERVTTWRMTADWQDVGQPAELRRARGE